MASGGVIPANRDSDQGYSGSVLPFSRDASGVHFDPHAGILGSILNAFSLPGDVYSGKTPVNDANGNPTPAVMDRAAGLASLVPTGGLGFEGAGPNAVLRSTRSAVNGYRPTGFNQNYRMLLDGSDVGGLSVNNEDPLNLWVNYVGNTGAANSVGPRGMRSILQELQRTYPDAASLTGYRSSGARVAAGAPTDATVSLPGMGAVRAAPSPGVNLDDVLTRTAIADAESAPDQDTVPARADGGPVSSLDLSSLSPVQMGGASMPVGTDAQTSAGGFDVSALRPYGTPDPATSSPQNVSRDASDESESSGPPSIGTVAKQFGYGVLQGIPHAVEGTADLAEGALTSILHPFASMQDRAKYLQDAKSGKAIAAGLNTVGLDPDQLPAPATPPERVANTAGQVGAQMAAPESWAADLGWLSRLGRVAKAGTVGTVAGGTGQTAAEVAPEPLKPLASMAGTLIGGGGASTALEATEAGARAARNFVSPLTTAGQERAAGTILAKNASNPEAAISAIANADRELVPGSEPTTFQLTGDMGLGSLERGIATQNPAVFQALRASQNSARLDSLLNVQSEGHPEAVGDFFRNQLKALDSQSQQAVDDAQASARQTTAGLGGGRSPEAYGADIQSAVEPQMNAATEAARSAAEGLGGQGAESTAQQVRDALQARLTDVKANEQRLWNAVDPDKTLTVVTAPLKRAVQSVYGDIGPEKAATLSPIENQFASIVGDYGPTLPFQRLTDLRSAVSAAMRTARSPLQPNEAAYGRLAQLRGAIEDSIADSVTGQVAKEQAGIQAGALSPEQGILARWANDVAGAQDVGRTVGRAAENPGTAPAGGEGPLPAEIRAGGESLGQPAGTEGNPQGQGSLVDSAAADRLKQASAATAERKATFGAEPVNRILQRPGPSYPYNAAAADVAAQLWKPGAKGAANVRAILKAANNAPDAVEAIRSAAASSLRGKSENGIVTPQVFAKWRAQHGPALEALEEAAPGTTARFASAAKAAEGLDRFATYGKTPVGALPDRYFAKGEAGFQSVNDLRELIGQDRADKVLGDYAADSVRKSASDQTGAIDPKKFATWRKAHEGALRALPDLSAKLETAAKAGDYLANVAERRRADLDAFQTGAVAKLLKVDDPADVTKTVGGLLGRNDSVKQMRDLAGKVAADPAAKEGLRKALVDYMADRLISNTEAATSGRNLLKSDAFQSFLGKNYTALRQVFSDDEMAQMRAIAQDLKRANRSISAVKLSGGSNTAQDTLAAQRHGPPSILHKILEWGASAGVPAFFGSHLAGPVGAVIGAIGGPLFNAMRETGITRIDGLVRDAMLDPDLARSLLMKAPKRPGTGSELTLANQLKRLSVLAPISAATQH